MAGQVPFRQCSTCMATVGRSTISTALTTLFSNQDCEGRVPHTDMVKRKAAEAAEASSSKAARKAQGQKAPKRQPAAAAPAAEPETAPAHVATAGQGFKNKEKVLMLSSRGITYR